MIEIDGSFGEGGGQILRTALSLSCLFNKPFRILNIRKGRKNPGLMPQHLTCVKAAQLLSDAHVEGDYIGSTDLVFCPSKIRGGDFFFDIGTAGSTSLVLQTLIPSLIFLNDKSRLTLKGGTHVPFSPCFHYISEVFGPTLEKIGIKINLFIESYGFYPKGGGKVLVEVLPVDKIGPLYIDYRGKILRLKGYSGTANLPLSIAERQIKGALERLSSINGLDIQIKIMDVKSIGEGTFLFIKSESENSIAGFTSLGQKGKKAEDVGYEAAKGFIDYFFSGAALDNHLPDQIVLYLALSSGESFFSTSCITNHLITNLFTIRLFHEFKYHISGNVGEKGEVRIYGRGIS